MMKKIILGLLCLYVYGSEAMVLTKGLEVPDTDSVILRLSDSEVKIEVGLARISHTLQDLILASGIEQPIPLQKISLQAWKSILPFLENFYAVRQNVLEQQKAIQEILESIARLASDEFVRILNAANYLNVQALLELLIKNYNFTKLRIADAAALIQNYIGCY